MEAQLCSVICPELSQFEVPHPSFLAPTRPLGFFISE